jgi:hypothetical protein
MTCYGDSFTFLYVMIFVPHRKHIGLHGLLRGQLYFLHYLLFKAEKESSYIGPN